MGIRLGDILVRQGVIDEQQRAEILTRQRQVAKPFGVLAESLFGVDPGQVEQAWAEQYSSFAKHVDPLQEQIDSEVIDLVEPRQAWQFGVMPMRFEGGELIICTTQANLPRALRFAGWRIMHLCSFVLCEPDQLSDALNQYYPMAGMEQLVEQRLTG